MSLKEQIEKYSHLVENADVANHYYKAIETDVLLKLLAEVIAFYPESCRGFEWDSEELFHYARCQECIYNHPDRCGIIQFKQKFAGFVESTEENKETEK